MNYLLSLILFIVYLPSVVAPGPPVWEVDISAGDAECQLAYDDKTGAWVEHCVRRLYWEFYAPPHIKRMNMIVRFGEGDDDWAYSRLGLVPTLPDGERNYMGWWGTTDEQGINAYELQVWDIYDKEFAIPVSEICTGYCGW